MYSHTNSRTGERWYVCRNVHNGEIANDCGLCDQPWIDAARVDAAILAHLDHLFVDFDAWLESISEANTGHRAGVEADRDAADERVRQLQEALAAIPAEPPTDAMLDVFNGLARAVQAGDHSDNLADLNERLRAVFSEFRLDAIDEDVAGVMPVLREDAIARHWASGATPAMFDNDGAMPIDTLPECIPAIVWATTPDDDSEGQSFSRFPVVNRYCAHAYTGIASAASTPSESQIETSL